MLKKFWGCLPSVALLVSGLAVGMLFNALHFLSGDPQGGIGHLHGGPTLEKIRSLASLVVLKAEVADIQMSELHGYSGGIRALLLVKGDATIGTDLAQARFESVDEERQEAVLVLPPPRVQSARVDHERTRLLGLWRSGLWEIVPGDRPEEAIVNRVFAEAQRIIEGAAGEKSLDQRARAQSEAVLGRFFEAMHWRVTIHWTDHVETDHP
jgi:hypothetical protein